MRGKHAWRHDGGSGEGLIPAHAGKTYALSVRLIVSEAHPRACGENRVNIYFRVKGEGSSPRMRGKQVNSLAMSVDLGLIPAHAGKTPCEVVPVVISGAHPRACGENCISPAGLPASHGSSPRMRGKLAPRMADCWEFGLIPAHAGKTYRLKK